MKRIQVSIDVAGVRRESILSLELLPAHFTVPLHVDGRVIPVEVSIDDADAGDLPSFLARPPKGSPAAGPPTPPMKGPPAGPRPPGSPPGIFSRAREKVPAHELNAA